MVDFSDCDQGNVTGILTLEIYNFTYYGLLPIYFIFGLLSNIVLLLAFYKRSKVEQTYAYQVLLTVSKTLEVFTFGTFQMGQKWFSGVGPNGSDWFQKQYFLMFYTLKLATWAHMHFITSSLIISVAMAADRAFALSFPFRYKNFNHSRRFIVAALICFTLPFASSPSNINYFKIEKFGDRYVGAVDEVFTATVLAKVCFDINVCIRVAGLVLLIIFNVIIIIKFRKRNTKIAQMTNIDQKNEAKKAADKTLVLLNIYQSALMCVNQLPHVFVYVMFALVPSFERCYGAQMDPIADSCIMITDSFDIFVIMAINKKMRNIVKNALKCNEGGDSTQTR